MEIFSSFSSQILNGSGTLSIFPALFGYSLLAPTILRIVSGIFFASIGIANIKAKTGMSAVAGILQILTTLSLLAGFLTQIGAIVGMGIIIGRIFNNFSTYDRSANLISFHLTILSILISLLLTGAGAFALDLPL